MRRERLHYVSGDEDPHPMLEINPTLVSGERQGNGPSGLFVAACFVARHRVKVRRTLAVFDGIDDDTDGIRERECVAGYCQIGPRPGHSRAHYERKLGQWAGSERVDKA